jgi:hypothetical protein
VGISFLVGRVGKGVGSDVEVPVSADDPLPVSLPAGTSIPVAPAAGLTGGVPNNFQLPTSAATNNAANVKASQGQVFFVIAYNTSTTLAYLKLFNTAGVPNMGVASPVMTLPIPPGGGIALDLNIAIGLFANGIGMALTRGAALNDNTAVAAGDIVGVNIGYA